MSTQIHEQCMVQVICAGTVQVLACEFHDVIACEHGLQNKKCQYSLNRLETNPQINHDSLLTGHIGTPIYRSILSERPPYFHARMARKRGGAEKR